MSSRSLFRPAPEAYCRLPMNTISKSALARAAFALPNLLTYARIAAVPVVVDLLYWQSILDGGLWIRWVALAVFIAAAYRCARRLFRADVRQQSSLGRMLDPIADKLLVASCLLMLAAEETIRGWSLLASVVILCREILVSAARISRRASRQRPGVAAGEMEDRLAARRGRFLIAGDAGDKAFSELFKQDTLIITNIGLALLWLSALVTLYTGWDYMRAGVRHMIDMERLVGRAKKRGDKFSSKMIREGKIADD